MILIIASALGAGLATVALIAWSSPLLALVVAPIAGSAAVLAAAFLLAWRRGPDWQPEVDPDLQADAMVAALREMRARGQILTGQSVVPQVKVPNAA